jgi:hypothetical protein
LQSLKKVIGPLASSVNMYIVRAMQYMKAKNYSFFNTFLMNIQKHRISCRFQKYIMLLYIIKVLCTHKKLFEKCFLFICQSEASCFGITFTIIHILHICLNLFCITHDLPEW